MTVAELFLGFRTYEQLVAIAIEKTFPDQVAQNGLSRPIEGC